ncbi:hypothetical protein GJ496_008257 [Pomphorhynchus laevis]|nr:hypothetical protein GJ496_008257 [Pomphorhynchus laevis]
MLKCNSQKEADFFHSQLFYWYFQLMNNPDNHLYDDTENYVVQVVDNQLSSDQRIEDSVVDEDNNILEVLESYPQLFDFYRRIQLIEKHNPFILKEFKNVFILLANELRSKQSEINNLVHSLDSQKDALKRNFMLYEEEVEKEIEQKVDAVRKEEIAIRENMINALRKKYEDIPQPSSPCDTNNYSTICKAGTMRASSEYDSINYEQALQRCIDDDIKKLHKIFETKLSEIQREKDIIGDMIVMDSDGLRKQFNELVVLNRDLHDENDELRSSIMELTNKLSRLKGKSENNEMFEYNPTETIQDTDYCLSTGNNQLDYNLEDCINKLPSTLSDSIVMQQYREETCKIIFIGDSGVGKTSLIRTFCDLKFDPNYKSTIGIDFNIKIHFNNGFKTTVQLWDTAGQERFRSLSKQYYRKADGIIIVYDVMSEESFTHVRSWLVDAQHNSDYESVPIMLIANKCDLREKHPELPFVNQQYSKVFAMENGIQMFDCSAFDSEKVTQILNVLLSDIRIRKDNLHDSSYGNGIKIAKVQEKKCCFS